MYLFAIVGLAVSCLPPVLVAWNGFQDTLVPAYFYPGAEWDKMIAAGAGIIIANPGSGPGSAYDSNYGTYINKTRKVPIDTIGYVYTSYGQRPLADVKADIQKYLKWYNVNGFFFDETLADATREAYYTNLANYVRSIKPSYLVVLNPGVIPTVKTYFDFADLVVIKEDYMSTSSSFTIPKWLCAIDASSICIMYHTATSSQMLAAVSKGKKLNAGFMYITDDTMNNPYDRLPTYYKQEVDALAVTSSSITCTGV